MECVSCRREVPHMEGAFCDRCRTQSNTTSPPSGQLNKYQRCIKGVVVDFYDIAKAYGIHDPAIAHALKKLLRYGSGEKPLAKDIAEAKWSLTRWEEQQNENTV